MTVMHTASGVRVDLAHPYPEDIRLVDIAHHLSQINRFAGATNWSVAAHSLLACELMPDAYDAGTKLVVLLHDGHEAYTNDLTSPVKAALEFFGGDAARDAVKDMQSRIDDALYLAAGIASSRRAIRGIVKKYDLLALAHEKRRFMPDVHPEDWAFLPDTDSSQPLADRIIDRLHPTWGAASWVASVFRNKVCDLIREERLLPHGTFFEGVIRN